VGAREHARVARLLERAGTHQRRAVRWIQRARDPSRVLPAARQRAEMLLALEELLLAERTLRAAHEGAARARDAALVTLVAQHRGRLEGVIDATERRLQGLVEAGAEHG